MGKRKRPCVFCGAGTNSREHVWPEWLKGTDAGRLVMSTSPKSRAAPKYIARPEMVMDRSANTTYVMPTYVERGVPPVPLETVVKAPCRECNQGWMSRLEGDRKDLLTDLMHPRPYRSAVSETESKLLFRWAAKTSAMYEFDDPTTKTYSREVLRAIMEDRPLPGAWRMWAVRGFNPSSPFRPVHADLRASTARGVVFGPASQSLLLMGHHGMLIRFCLDEHEGLVPMDAGLEHLPPDSTRLLFDGSTPAGAELPGVELTVDQQNELARGQANWYVAAIPYLSRL